jgi:hypothetical protein
MGVSRAQPPVATQGAFPLMNIANDKEPPA